MNCKQIQYSYYDYADDLLDRDARSVIESHLSGCAACRLHYETQCRLHQSVTNVAAAELADMHFRPGIIKAGSSSAYQRPSLGSWIRQMAYAIPAFLLFGIILWPLMKPAPKPVDDPAQSAYTEAFHYLEMYSTDKPGASSFAAPVAVIIRPGAPARVIELDGTTDVSAELK